MSTDPVHDVLDSLRDDVAQVPLADAGAVRRRGDRRQRRQRVAGAAGAVAAVAVVAAGVGLLQGPAPSPPTPPATQSLSVPPPSTGTTTGTSTGSTSPTDTSSATTPATPATRSVITVQPVGVGDVPARYFLPGRYWRGPDLNDNAAIVSAALKESEGSIQYFDCDPDTRLKGDVALVQATERSGGYVGVQKVRVLGSVQAAQTLMDELVAAMPRCQARLRAQAIADAGPLPSGETAPVPNATVVEDPQSQLDDASGSLRVYRTTSDYGTPASSKTIEWVVLAREGSTVTSVAIRKSEDTQATFGALRRIGSQARDQLRWALAQ
ncbi:hypothetical protein [Angustibacter luteus]|uniref:PknH-like extracellular domain-containing protein n=1 Tax=Angustibacter luteus TaxID=658456 RepID=A0ABW1JH91_9ACTN